MSKIIKITDRTSESFDAYLKNIKYTHPLTTEEEHELGRRSQQGDIDARNKLIEANQLLVVSCANAFYNKSVPMDELVAAGRLGLVIAATRYSPTFEGRFTSYAVYYIREYIRQAISEYLNQMHIPYRVLKAARKKAPSVNDELDFEELIDWEPTGVFAGTFESLDADFDIGSDEAPCRTLIERVAAPIDTEALEYALRESATDLRTFLSGYYAPMDVDILMDYAHKLVEGYTVKDLAHEYRLSEKRMKKYVDQLLEKVELLKLKAAYLKAA